MAIPISNTQLPLDAILDLNGKQAYLGNSFILPYPAKALNDQTEDPLCVIQNPSGSGKSLFIFNRKIMSDNNVVLVKFYLNPVLNVPGSATAAINLRTGSTLASIAKCYNGASITSNGTFFEALAANAPGNSSNVLLILDPGASILLTGTQETSTGPSNVYFECAWYEI